MPAQAQGPDFDAIDAEFHSLIEKHELAAATKKAVSFRELFEKTLGKSDPHYGDAIGNLSIIAMMNSDYAKAELYAKQALEIFGRANPVDKNKLAAAMIGLMSVYGIQGKKDEAQALLDRAMKLRLPGELTGKKEIMRRAGHAVGCQEKRPVGESPGLATSGIAVRPTTGPAS